MSLRKNISTYKSFREETPTRALKVRIELPKTAWVLGTLESVEYFSTLNGRAVKFKHKFTRGSRPMLAAGSKRGQLFIVGGRFRVTERGIVDLTPTGKELDD